MLKINLICIGTLKEKYLKDAEKEYLKRLSKYSKLNIIELKESEISSFENENLIKKTLDDEAKKILNIIKDNEYVILLDLHGNEIDSIEFSKLIDDVKTKSFSTIDFVIGGTLGLGDELRKRSNKKIALSKLTFTHQLTRIIFLEQIYRAFKILNNESYHH